MVAESCGIPSATESSLRHHFHPREVWPEDFRESHTLTVLGDGLVAYCHALSIGVGYDGRRDTLCSHALVLASDAFKEHGYDTRILDSLHPGSRRVRGELPAAEIDPPQLPPAGVGGLEQVLRGALGPVLSGKRTAAQSDDPTAAQDLLSLIPSPPPKLSGHGGSGRGRGAAPWRRRGRPACAAEGIKLAAPRRTACR